MTAAERQAARERCDKASKWNKLFERRGSGEAWRIIGRGTENDDDFDCWARTDLPAALDALDAADQRIAELEALVGEDKLNLFSRLKNEQAKASNRMTAGCRSCRESVKELLDALKGMNVFFGSMAGACEEEAEEAIRKCRAAIARAGVRT